MKRIILILTLLTLAGILAHTVVYGDMVKMKSGFKFAPHKELQPWSKFQLPKKYLQLFVVKDMEQKWYRSGLLTQEEWYDKLENHCRSNHLYPTVCSYCDSVVKLNKGLAGISHGICPNCMERAYLDNDLLPDPEMIDAQKEFNELNRTYEVYTKRS